MPESVPDQIHATCVAIDGAGILLRGPAGAGKSDLALRLMDEGAMLVADDRVDLKITDGQLIASPPDNLAGLFEARGVGIMRLSYLPSAPVHLLVDLMSRDNVPRLPDALSENFGDTDIRVIALDPFDVSSTAKIRLALSTGPKAMVEPS